MDYKKHQRVIPALNDLSPGMWDEQEWYDYLAEHGGDDMVVAYHPEAFQKAPSLEEFF